MISILIEKELVQKAKEKLGEKNADIIAEVMNLEKYDSINKKALCPYHEESTPSFIYNSNSHSFHSFCCGRNTDIIDAYMSTGDTYLEAVQKLFELAKIKYAFGEMGVKTKHGYNYPKEVVCDNKDKVYKYLKTRKISKDTADYLDIRQDEDGNLVFNYYDLNDCLTMVKYRPSHKIKKGQAKNWVQKDSDSSPLLFNMNRINTDAPLLICCGELDCAAAIEAGWRNAVSIPLGDSNTHWIKENFDWLEKFDEIIVAHDNDESGTKFMKTVVPMLGSWRCKIMNVPEFFEKEDGTKISVKDINEALYYFGKEKVIDLIIHASDSPVPSLMDFSKVKDADISDIDGITVGLKEIDKTFIRFFWGTYNVLSGTPGSGKTSLLNQFICQCLDQGYGAWVYSKELPMWMTKNWIQHLLSGDRHLKRYENSNNSVYYKVPYDVKEKIDDYYAEKLMLYRDDYPNDVESIKISMEDSARKYSSKLFILDNLMCISLGENENNKNEKQTEFVNWLIQFATKFQTCVILVCHPNKTQDYNENIGMYSIAGTSNIINLAHRAIGIRRVTKKEKEGIRNQRGEWIKEPRKHDAIVSCIKDRLTGRMDLECGLYYSEGSRRFFSDYEEYAHQYNWDDVKYEESPPIPRQLAEEEEVFGADMRR